MFGFENMYYFFKKIFLFSIENIIVFYMCDIFFISYESNFLCYSSVSSFLSFIFFLEHLIHQKKFPINRL